MFRNAVFTLPAALALAGTVSAESYQEPESVLQGIIDKVDSKYLTQSYSRRY